MGTSFILFSGIELTQQAEVDAFYNSGDGADPTEVVSILGGTILALWEFNETPTTTLIEDSGTNSYAGTLINFAGGGDASERPEFNP